MLDLEIDDLSAVDEKVQGFYEKADNGKFRLKVKGVEDVSGLKSAYQKTKENLGMTEKELKAYKSLGMTPEEIKQVHQELQRIKEQELKQKAEKTGDWETVKKQMQEGFNKEIDTYKQELSILQNQIKTAQVSTAIASAKGNPKLLTPHVNSFVSSVKNENGGYDLIVIDNAGKQRFNDKGDPLTISELLSEMRNDNDFAMAFESSGSTGSGSMSIAKSGKAQTINKPIREMTPQELAQYQKSKQS